MLEVHTNASFVPSGEKDGEAMSQQCKSGLILLDRKVSRESRNMCEPFSSVDQYAKDLESGDQLICMKGSCQNVASTSFLSGPPKAGTTKTPLSFCDRRANAICVPSGDHAGLIQREG